MTYPSATAVETAASPGAWAKLRALHELGKPNLSLLVVVTAVLGFFLASRAPAMVDRPAAGWLAAIMLVLGTALTAMGACAANMCREAEIDGRMVRTRRRPLPSGRVTEEEAFAYALGTFLVGFSFLYAFCGPLPALLAVGTTVVYAFVYTPAKLHGPVSVWIGAIPGAIPPVMGWTTVTGEIGLGGLALFALLFTWQFPHFLALAYMYRADYARAGFRFLPEVDTERRTGLHIALGSVAVFVASLAPMALGLTGWVYAAIALAAGGALVVVGLASARRLDARTARRAFFASIIYLPALLIALALDGLLLGA